MFFGVLLIILGIVAMASPMIAGLSVALMLGYLLLFSGVIKLVFALMTKSGLSAILWALLTAAAGMYMLMNPQVALATLIILLSVFLVVSGIFEGLLALGARPASGWIWGLISAALSVVLGIMIWAQFPIAGTMAIGILLGLKLLFSGITLLMLGSTVRKVTKTATNQA